EALFLPPRLERTLRPRDRRRDDPRAGPLQDRRDRERVRRLLDAARPPQRYRAGRRAELQGEALEVRLPLLGVELHRGPFGPLEVRLVVRSELPRRLAVRAAHGLHALGL